MSEDEQTTRVGAGDANTANRRDARVEHEAQRQQATGRPAPDGGARQPADDVSRARTDRHAFGDKLPARSSTGSHGDGTQGTPSGQAARPGRSRGTHGVRAGVGAQGSSTEGGRFAYGSAREARDVPQRPTSQSGAHHGSVRTGGTHAPASGALSGPQVRGRGFAVGGAIGPRARVDRLDVEGLIGASAFETATYKPQHLRVSVLPELAGSMQEIEGKFQAGVYDAQAMPLVSEFLDRLEELAQIQVEREEVDAMRVNDIKEANAAAFDAVCKAREEREAGIEALRLEKADSLSPYYDGPLKRSDAKAQEKSRRAERKARRDAAWEQWRTEREARRAESREERQQRAAVRKEEQRRQSEETEKQKRLKEQRREEELAARHEAKMQGMQHKAEEAERKRAMTVEKNRRKADKLRREREEADAASRAAQAKSDAEALRARAEAETLAAQAKQNQIERATQRQDGAAAGLAREVLEGEPQKSAPAERRASNWLDDWAAQPNGRETAAEADSSEVIAASPSEQGLTGEAEVSDGMAGQASAKPLRNDGTDVGDGPDVNCEAGQSGEDKADAGDTESPATPEASPSVVHADADVDVIETPKAAQVLDGDEQQPEDVPSAGDQEASEQAVSEAEGSRPPITDGHAGDAEHASW